MDEVPFFLPSPVFFSKIEGKNKKKMTEISILSSVQCFHNIQLATGLCSELCMMIFNFAKKEYLLLTTNYSDSCFNETEVELFALDDLFTIKSTPLLFKSLEPEPHHAILKVTYRPPRTKDDDLWKQEWLRDIEKLPRRCISNSSIDATDITPILMIPPTYFLTLHVRTV